MTGIPHHIEESEAASRRFKVKLSEALSRRMSESDWKKFATLNGLDHLITDHHRFLRAARFDDPDYEGLVLDVVNHLYDSSPGTLVELFKGDAIQRWFKQNDAEFLELWDGAADPVIEALGHALEEVHGVGQAIDLREHTTRLQAALPHDPAQAIGATKDMLEATMRTILRDRGHKDVEKLDYQALSTKCLLELGLTTNSPPATADEKYTRKIISSARGMIDAANELRNAAGTGHGRAIGDQVALSAEDASLVASTGLVLAAWLIKHSQREP